MKKKSFVLCLGFVLILSACNRNPYPGFEQNAEGLFYQFHTINEGKRMPENNEVVLMSLIIKTEKDSLVEAKSDFNTMMQKAKYPGDIFTALSMMHLGDSATFILNAKQYFEVYRYGQIPSFVNDKSILKMSLKIDTIYSYQEYIAAASEMRAKAEKQDIESYLQSNAIEGNVLPSGLVVVTNKEGRGKLPEEGKTCVVHYTGKLLDGSVFDSSVERGQPFEFVLGKGQVIKGWEEGIALMKKGGKATFVIPSDLGYGERGAGADIPPFSTLIFEVELLDIK